MEMTYESFVETLRTNLLEATGYDENLLQEKRGISADARRQAFAETEAE